jgi:hypothetical protein
MENAKENVRQALDATGLTWEEAEGYRAIWKAGGDLNEMASAAGAERLQFTWLLLMLDTVHFELQTKPTV